MYTYRCANSITSVEECYLLTISTGQPTCKPLYVAVKERSIKCIV